MSLKRASDSSFQSPAGKKTTTHEPPRGYSPNKTPLTSSNFITAEHSLGTMFVTQKNKHRAFVLPSTKNFVDCGGPAMQLRLIKSDSGCNVSLFHFEDRDHLAQALHIFPKEDYYHKITHFSSVGSNVMALEFKPKKLNGMFELRLEMDILPATLYKREPLQTPAINFHLSDSDILALLGLRKWKHPKAPALSNVEYEILSEELEYIMNHRAAAKKAAEEAAKKAKAKATATSTTTTTTAALESKVDEAEEGLEPHAMEEPHVAIEEPHAMTEEPHTTTEHPHITIEEPHAMTEEPHTTTEHPHITIEEPHAMTEEPHTTTEHPHVTIEEPHAMTEEPQTMVVDESPQGTSASIAEALTDFDERGLGAVYLRRTWSLLGQDITKQLGLVKSESVELWVDRAIHKLQLWSWGAVYEFEKNILACKYLTGPLDADVAELNMITNDTEQFDYEADLEEGKSIA